MTTDKFLTGKQAAEYLGVTQSWIIKLIQLGKLDAELVDAPVKYYLVSKASLEKYKNEPKDKGGRPRKREDS